jgi:hypothetical protein
MTGMHGVYLVAAELTSQGFIVSPTSRSAAGADLLVTDQQCRKAWSVQVKTNGKPGKTWLLGKHAKRLYSDTHVYVFVNLRKNGAPDYLVVPSSQVAKNMREKERTTGSTWYWFDRESCPDNGAGWQIFGDPHAHSELEDQDGPDPSLGATLD